MRKKPSPYADNRYFYGCKCQWKFVLIALMRRM